MRQADKANLEELEIDEDNRQQKQEFRQRKRQDVFRAREKRRHGPAEHMTHGQVKQGDGECEGDNETHADLLALRFSALLGSCSPRRARRSPI